MLRRTPMRRRYRDTGPDAKTRELVLERDEYGCVYDGWNRDLQLHHRLPRKSGGRADRRASNSPANLLTLCRDCHDLMESRRDEAYEIGYLVREHDDPAETPVAHRIYGLVYLLPDGTTEPVPHLGGVA
jgi:5-methylcytosine-specific restriction enzyme A